MGIQIMNKDGNVQLMHVADLAINAQYSEEGLVFMKEMIQLNEEASYPPEQEDAFRFVSILANEMPTLLAGPAQFGNNFKKGPLVGSIAKSKICIFSTLKCHQETSFRLTSFCYLDIIREDDVSWWHLTVGV